MAATTRRRTAPKGSKSTPTVVTANPARRPAPDVQVGPSTQRLAPALQRTEFAAISPVAREVVRGSTEITTRETTLDNASHLSSLGVAPIASRVSQVRIRELSARAAERFANFGYAAAGAALRFAVDSVIAGAQAKELAGPYITSLEHANKLAAHAVRCSESFAVLAVESQTNYAKRLGEAALELAVIPLRVTALELA
jgi:hypothetical protein